MPADICIVHVEDEFTQMKSFPSKMKDYVEQFHNDAVGGDNFTSMKELKDPDNLDPGWVVYDIKSPVDDDRKIRYIFIAGKTISEKPAEYFVGSPHFIIDVLRPSADSQKLFATGSESIVSAMTHGGCAETITIFTACQGSDLIALTSDYPDIQIISKANSQELNRLISRIVVEGMSHV